jgi:hypothetical protein
MRKALGYSLALAMATAGTAIAVGAGAPQALADSGCLWAGTSYSPSTLVTANGFGYICHVDANGNASWAYTSDVPSYAIPVPFSVDTDITNTSGFSNGAEVGWGGEIFQSDGGFWNDLGECPFSGGGGGGGGIVPLLG